VRAELYGITYLQPMAQSGEKRRTLGSGVGGRHSDTSLAVPGARDFSGSMGNGF